MIIKTFLINLLIGIFGLFIAAINLFAFGSEFADLADNRNIYLIILDIAFIIFICAYNIIPVIKGTISVKELIAARLLPMFLPFIIIIVFSVVKWIGEHNLPTAILK